jgi:hypothetical protein
VLLLTVFINRIPVLQISAGEAEGTVDELKMEWKLKGFLMAPL